jgi:hypothetical protein
MGGMAKKDIDGVRIKVFVKPRAKKNAVVGIQGDALKIQITSPPVEGAANRDLQKFLAKILGIAPSRVEIISGHRSRHKTLRMMGLTLEEVFAGLWPDATRSLTPDP